ncbi:MAG TPA: O-antigen ligase family protein [Candidatus Omnitrophota bacterium]|nr:O-antigen ligase family protein [Candidatus Omnitrophota bacterium]HQO38336.1 O-antigen ligase family protein [Candidatus Omnitrophota bacterium]HQQ06728.1 O-antigen ligase family protein [Candidatus Omnitrophota bacterium]
MTILALTAAVIAMLMVNLSVLSAGLTCTMLACPFIVMRPETYFVLFLLTRPMIDIAADYSIGGMLNPAALYTLLLIGVCGALIMRKQSLKVIFSDRVLVNFNIMFSIFLAACLASLFNSRYIRYSVLDFIRLLSILITVNYVAVYFRGKKRSVLLLKLIILSSILPLGMAAYQLIFHRGIMDAGFHRVLGTFRHPNVFSQYLVMVFLVLFYLIQSPAVKRYQRILLYCFLGIVAAALFKTYTRGAWIGLSAALIFFLFVKNPLIKKMRYLVIVLLVAAALLPSIQRRFSDVGVKDENNLSSWQWRLQQWSRTIDFVKENPIVGKGIGVFEVTYDIGVHNDYLRIAYETGFAGFLSYLGLMLYMLSAAFVKLGRARSYADANRYKLSASLMIAFMIMSVSDNLARSTVIVLYYFTVAAFFLAGTSTDEPDKTGEAR